VARLSAASRASIVRLASIVPRVSQASLVLRVLIAVPVLLASPALRVARVVLALPALLVMPALLGGCGPPHAKPAAGASSSSYAERIAPILAQRCTSCHGAEKHKGKLALHEPDAITRGGADGVVIVPGDPKSSELVRRVKLPLDDDDHMPPKDRPQLGADEIAAIEAWVAAGASFEDGVPAAKASTPASAPAANVPPADARAIAALEAALVHVEKSDPATELVWIDFAANAPKWSDDELEKALAPLAPQVSVLSLARTRVGARTIALAARMPWLERLDLRKTDVDDAALASLRGHARLEELVLVHTKLTDASVATLLALPALKRVYLWESGITPDSIAHLSSERPKLAIVSDDAHASTALETEPPLKLTNEAPIPAADAKSAHAATSLAPVNATCPVSGKPVDKKYSVVFEGRVIGFCCAKCPIEFWADPQKFTSKLP
jgi:mono/diheme cytochrome c family protein/YHS domain-containing protein